MRVLDFYQPRNQVQVHSERVVSMDVEEHASYTGQLLIELEVKEFVAPVTVSANQLASTYQVVTFADVYVSVGEDMSSSRIFRVSSPTEAFLNPESRSGSEYSDKDDAEYHVTSTQTEVQRDLPYDEDLSSDIPTLIRLMETIMDAEQEKLFSGDVNFKCTLEEFWKKDSDFELVHFHKLMSYDSKFYEVFGKGALCDEIEGEPTMLNWDLLERHRDLLSCEA
ncbi:hypothetical protein EVAR_20702_1 [Eumeta japonica]|uniref:Uncharacterized protein n=1 Tax=Eumeta variegata TaxID=151549 RepID=A0A4C1V9H1_EUMVA|nr:hypothetical protein EVAR_20702_1 [Eumeta japonica]